MAYTKTTWVNDQTELNAQNMNHIEDGIANTQNVQLIAVSDTAPSECQINDKYYNTEDNLIYTATNEDTWSEDGEEPIYDILYIILDEKTTYTYNGETLISVGGGGGGGITVAPDEPTEDTKLYIESMDLDAQYEVNEDKYSTNETLTNKVWIDGKPIYRKVIEITDTNPSASNWKEYTYTTLGLSSTIELCMFPEAYTQITQAGKLYTESFYSNGSRVQTAPADSKVNVLGNGASYSKYIIIAEYTKTTD